jgi:Spy/CpxP family protein refolding chaperone
MLRSSIAPFGKGARMNRNRIAKRVTVAAGAFFLCMTPGLIRAQTAPPGPAQAPQMVSPAAPPRKSTPPPDYFAGLTFTDDQKAKIAQIVQNAKMRVDTVNKAEKLSPDQKEAMVEGYRHMTNGEIFKVLTPEQQTEVRKRIRAQRAAMNQGEQQKKPTPQ